MIGFVHPTLCNANFLDLWLDATCRRMVVVPSGSGKSSQIAWLCLEIYFTRSELTLEVTTGTSAVCRAMSALEAGVGQGVTQEVSHQ